MFSDKNADWLLSVMSDVNFGFGISDHQPGILLPSLDVNSNIRLHYNNVLHKNFIIDIIVGPQKSFILF